jgi:hypothetical protein
MAGGTTGGASWSDLPRRATLAVGVKQPDAVGVDRFSTGGAAVLIQDSRNRIFVATALHVFYQPKIHWAPETLQIRGWRDEGKDRYKEFGSTLLLRANGKPLYVASTKFDLAILPATQELLNRLLDDDHKYFALRPTDIAGVDDTYDGADVFILGFPSLVGDQYQQRALMRSGIIAWTDSSGPIEHEFLVDSRIFPGNSGGPVFSSAAGMTRRGALQAGKQIKLLGLVSQTINARPEVALGMQLPKEGVIIGAAGVGVIEPAYELVDLMAQVP